MIALRITLPAAREDAAVTLLWELGNRRYRGAARCGRRGLSPELLSRGGNGVLWARGADRQGPADATIEAADVPDVDWVARFRDGFRPFSVGTFRIVPAWDDCTAADARTLRIDPAAHSHRHAREHSLVPAAA